MTKRLVAEVAADREGGRGGGWNPRRCLPSALFLKADAPQLGAPGLQATSGHTRPIPERELADDICQSDVGPAARQMQEGFSFCALNAGPRCSAPTLLVAEWRKGRLKDGWAFYRYGMPCG